MLFGASFKYTVINSEGSIFYDKPGDPLEIYELGAFLQYTDEWASKKIFPNKVSLNKPDFIILIEILGDNTGISILKDSELFSLDKSKRLSD